MLFMALSGFRTFWSRMVAISQSLFPLNSVMHVMCFGVRVLFFNGGMSIYIFGCSFGSSLPTLKSTSFVYKVVLKIAKRISLPVSPL